MYIPRMPRISEFFGIVIEMFWREHGPPHFHASYAEFEAVIDLESLDIIRGSLPNRAAGLVRDWSEQNHTALMENWERCGRLEHPLPIPPLQ